MVPIFESILPNFVFLHIFLFLLLSLNVCNIRKNEFAKLNSEKQKNYVSVKKKKFGRIGFWFVQKKIEEILPTIEPGFFLLINRS